jgi:ABC-type lipoprotein export system ATPase subunit
MFQASNRILYRLDNISKNYKIKDGNILALETFSFEIDEGEFLVTKGESGAGKSTLLYILAGLVKPSSGKVFFRNRNLYPYISWGLSNFRNKHVGFIFQDFQLMPGLTVWENVQLPLLFSSQFKKKESIKNIPLLLEKLGLEKKDKQYPHQLSGGEAQRVAIARALINRPAVVFADEPTGNLDAKTETKILKILNEARQTEKFTLIVASHSKKFISKADRVITLSKGRIEP